MTTFKISVQANQTVGVLSRPINPHSWQVLRVECEWMAYKYTNVFAMPPNSKLMGDKKVVTWAHKPGYTLNDAVLALRDLRIALSPVVTVDIGKWAEYTYVDTTSHKPLVKITKHVERVTEPLPFSHECPRSTMRIRPGAYLHYKGGDYNVIGVAHSSEAGLEDIVVYHKRGKERIHLFYMTVSEWTKPVTGESMPRYKKFKG